MFLRCSHSFLGTLAPSVSSLSFGACMRFIVRAASSLPWVSRDTIVRGNSRTCNSLSEGVELGSF